jgi:hypothetical protein
MVPSSRDEQDGLPAPTTPLTAGSSPRTQARRASAAAEIAALRRRAREADMKLKAAQDARQAVLEAAGEEASGGAECTSLEDTSSSASSDTSEEGPDRDQWIREAHEWSKNQYARPVSAAGGTAAGAVPQGSSSDGDDIIAVFINDGTLGLQFAPDSDPPFLVLAIKPGGLAARQPQLKSGLVLKAVNREPVDGRCYDEVFASVAAKTRPLALSFWRTYAPSVDAVVTASVHGAHVGTGFMRRSTTEYVVHARTITGRLRKLHRSFQQFQTFYYGWVRPLCSVAKPISIPSDVLYGASGAAVVNKRVQDLSQMLAQACELAHTVECGVYNFALQRFLREDYPGGEGAAAAPMIGTGNDCACARLPMPVGGSASPAAVWDPTGLWSWGSVLDLGSLRTHPRSVTLNQLVAQPGPHLRARVTHCIAH